MVKVEAVMRPQVVEAVKEALDQIGVHGITVIDVRGVGRQKGVTERYRGVEYTISLIPKTMMMAVINDDELDAVMKVIADVARTGEIGDGKIFVTPVLDAMRIRTGERALDAL